eukprot:111786-Rhodomonas_salina.3
MSCSHCLLDPYATCTVLIKYLLCVCGTERAYGGRRSLFSASGKRFLAQEGTARPRAYYGVACVRTAHPRAYSIRWPRTAHPGPTASPMSAPRIPVRTFSSVPPNPQHTISYPLSEPSDCDFRYWSPIRYATNKSPVLSQIILYQEKGVVEGCIPWMSCGIGLKIWPAGTAPLSAYAPAMRCPGAHVCATLGTDVAYGVLSDYALAMRRPVLAQRIALHTRYPMSGTEVPYQAAHHAAREHAQDRMGRLVRYYSPTPCLRHARYWRRGSILCSRFAMSGTALACGAEEERAIHEIGPYADSLRALLSAYARTMQYVVLT